MAIAYVAFRSDNWDPGKHPRGFHGHWATSGGILASAQKYAAGLAGKVKPRELDNYDVAQFKRERMDPAFRYTPEQVKAIRAYTENTYEDINGSARSGGDLGPQAKALSSAMQRMPEDLIVLREISGADVLSGVKPGDVIADDGFASTTLTSGGRYASGKSDTTVMHILTPAGTPVVWTGTNAGFPENEVILDHGQPMAVMKVQQRSGRSDVTDVYLLVLPKEVVHGKR